MRKKCIVFFFHGTLAHVPPWNGPQPDMLHVVYPGTLRCALGPGMEVVLQGALV